MEFLYQFGHAYTVKSDGTLSKRYKKTPDGSEEAEIVYCNECGYNLDERDYAINNNILILRD